MRAESRVDPRAPAAAVEEHADVMAARALFGREIDDMTKQAAQRRAKHMDNTEFRGRFHTPSLPVANDGPEVA